MGILADTIGAAIGDAFAVYNSRKAAEIYASAAQRTEIADGLPPMEAQTDAVFRSTTTSLDDIPETAGSGVGLVVLRNE